ncbi:D-hexose-6-phosphate mutarotase [Variovorax sp. J22G73]|uniref:D-hexose-6-phosphate mutarotase n=1 Tax=unclassified Variovorax TaxID=663243 RepID=UPI000D5E031A|nr:MULTISPECIES: D-hexose-6-phosphate mutarotase [unclassified Variovorax]MDM0004478.1 D-hexose-6-phosphate mutarotase [Variovorax sp. J22R203]MDM0095856.1 D-hexose-6-phosphate mutarotase [Variovorax sp. J22G73]
MEITPIEFRGQPALRATGADGSTLTVALHGAQVLSWTAADGLERLYLSPSAVFDGHTAIRGGVPVCCPQFNQRGMLPKHGFMRNLPWVHTPSDTPETLRLTLRDGDATRKLWPHAFEARLEATLSRGQLRIALTLRNLDSAPWTFAAALHTYLRVDNISNVRLEGLQGANRWDSLRDDRHVETAAALHFDAEFDSVYTAPAEPLRLVQPGGKLEISQSASCSETVVWNPGAVLGAKLADMPADGFRHMLCVEAARIDEPVLLAPGAEWQGWQQLRVL